MGKTMELGPIKYHTGTTAMTQHCSRQEHGRCDLRLINQVRSRRDGKEEVTDNTPVPRALSVQTQA